MAENLKNIVIYKEEVGGQTQDGRVGGPGVCISSQLGHLPYAGGGPQHPRGWEEPPSNWVGCQGSKGGGEVEAGWDQCP